MNSLQKNLILIDELDNRIDELDISLKLKVPLEKYVTYTLWQRIQNTKQHVKYVF